MRLCRYQGAAWTKPGSTGLFRARKFCSCASVYGTEGYRFESCRAYLSSGSPPVGWPRAPSWCWSTGLPL